MARIKVKLFFNPQSPLLDHLKKEAGRMVKFEIFI